MIEVLKSDCPIILYGNGNQGVICEETLVDALGFRVECFAKSDEYRGTPNRYSRLKSYLISELPYGSEDCKIIIALNREASNKVYAELKEKGYKYVYMCEDWEPVNLALREIRFWALLEDYAIPFDKFDDVFSCKNFRFTNPYKGKHNFLTFFSGRIWRTGSTACS